MSARINRAPGTSRIVGPHERREALPRDSPHKLIRFARHHRESTTRHVPVETATPGGASKWGAINKEGKVIIPFQFSKIPEPFSEGLAIVSCSNGTLGYVDRADKLAIPCQYSEAKHFVHGIAFVRPSSLIPMLIDKQGNIVADGKNLGLGLSELFRREDGLYAFLHTKIQTLTGLLDGNWKIVIPAQYERIGLFPADGDPEGLAWATSDEMGKNPHQGFINRHGDYILLQQASMF